MKATEIQEAMEKGCALKHDGVPVFVSEAGYKDDTWLVYIGDGAEPKQAFTVKSRDLSPAEPPAKYPECDKLSALADKKDLLLDFLAHYCKDHEIAIPDKDGRPWAQVSWLTIPHPSGKGRQAVSHESFVHHFLGIDEKKLEDERRAIIESLQR